MHAAATRWMTVLRVITPGWTGGKKERRIESVLWRKRGHQVRRRRKRKEGGGGGSGGENGEGEVGLLSVEVLVSF